MRVGSKVTRGESLVMEPDCQRANMVGWYDPSQLVQTGVKVAVSTVFGRHADSRVIEALNKPIGSAPESTLSSPRLDLLNGTTPIVRYAKSELSRRCVKA